MNNQINLYPPIVDTRLPSFVFEKTQKYRIYFTIPKYNDIKDIMHAQVTIVDSNTNLTILNTNYYSGHPYEIKICRILEDIDKDSSNRYYVEIEAKDLNENRFKLNTYYKIQIRFSSKNIPQDLPAYKLGDWLQENQDYFSEWSRPCLLKVIDQPVVLLKGFEDYQEGSIHSLSTENIDIIGRVDFKQSKETEYLKSYSIQLKQNNQILLDSGIIYTDRNNPNEINYTLNYVLENGQQYQILLSFESQNLYKQTNSYLIETMQQNINKTPASIAVTPDSENGLMKIHIFNSTINTFSGNISIRRSSGKTNFTRWEDLFNITFENQPLNYLWYDKTVENGVLYKYSIQFRNIDGDRGVPVFFPKPVMVISQNMFLLDGKRQLKIKYDPVISSFKQNVVETKTETIGSKYPIIRRNGNIQYKQFNISGTITSLMDIPINNYNVSIDSTSRNILNNNDNLKYLFTSPKECYGDLENLYSQQPEKNDLYEKSFRNKVINFLYDNNVKLFKSTQEGNILVKLMDINFTPQTALGRVIYKFSCNAYEINQCTINNYNKYKIQTVGSINTLLKENYSFVGQYNQYVQAGDKHDIIDILKNTYNKKYQYNHLMFSKVKYIRIVIESKPYLIWDDGKTVHPCTNTTNSQLIKNAVLGHILYINKNPFVLNKEGIYEIDASNMLINSIYFPVDVNVSIDFIIEMEPMKDAIRAKDKVLNVNKKSSYYRTIGQYSGLFMYDYSIADMIKRKYNNKNQKLKSIQSIEIEAEPGTIVYIKNSNTINNNKLIIGETGVLSLNSNDFLIEDIRFYGIYFQKSQNNNIVDFNTGINNYIIVSEIYSNIKNITTPLTNHVYKIGNSQQFTYYIYFQKKWYPFDNGSVKMPTYGIINYYCEIERKE